ncbi:MAG TPA: hypothetical protein PK562_07965, partial [Candidatus Omnitrophota bacterium]|nr:hypothetical protein [Candidatus Omnitrophota bacterium]
MKNSRVPEILSIWVCSVGVILCYSCGAFAQPPRYDIKAALDPARRSLEATQSVTFTNNSSKPVENLYFHIYPHRRYTRAEARMMSRYAGYFKVDPFPAGFQSGDLSIRDIRCGGARLSYIIEGADETILNVTLPSSLEPGGSVTIEMSYSVVIPHSYGRFGWHRNVITLTRWYPILCVLDDAGWHKYPFYVYHQPFFSDAAYYSL